MRLLVAAAVLFICGAFLLLPLISDQPAEHFRDVSKEAGVTPMIISGSREKNYVLEVNGSGACWFDYNNDGYMDLYLVNGATLEELLQELGVIFTPASLHDPDATPGGIKEFRLSARWTWGHDRVM